MLLFVNNKHSVMFHWKSIKYDSCKIPKAYSWIVFTKMSWISGGSCDLPYLEGSYFWIGWAKDLLNDGKLTFVGEAWFFRRALNSDVQYVSRLILMLVVTVVVICRCSS